MVNIHVQFLLDLIVQRSLLHVRKKEIECTNILVIVVIATRWDHSNGPQYARWESLVGIVKAVKSKT
jgi:hypothetical protein